jgi:hypothetical protein
MVIVIGSWPIIVVKINRRIRRINIAGPHHDGLRFPADLFHCLTHDFSVLPDSLGYLAAIGLIVYRTRDRFNG